MSIEWKKTEKPQLAVQIRDLEASLVSLHKQYEKDTNSDNKDIEQIEKDIKAHQEVLESVKKRYYFPRSDIVIGQAGVYAGLDNVWLEHASSHFVLDVISSVDKPQIKVTLTAGNSSEKGMSVRLKLEGFKLAGDRGKGIPKLNLSTVTVTLVLTVSMIVDFNPKTCKWNATSKNFIIKLLSFKGPYGISKSVMSAILMVVTPIIRTEILKALPLELGQLLSTLPLTTMNLMGFFDIAGTNISILTVPLHQNKVSVSVICAGIAILIYITYSVLYAGIERVIQCVHTGAASVPIPTEEHRP